LQGQDAAGGRVNERYPVAIAGGGPVGLALALARQGVRTVVLEEDSTVSDGSRALGMSRRTQDIWAALGIGGPVEVKGLPWFGGWTYYRGDLVLQYEIPHEPTFRHPPMLNLSQSDAERFMVDRLAACPAADLRWNTSVLGVVEMDDHVTAEIARGEERATLECQYLVACDGGRSKVRSTLGLRMEGVAGEAEYLIVDVQIDEAIQPGRRAWFDPASSPGTTVLMHGQPDNIWRIDWQILPGEDVKLAMEPANLTVRIDAHLAMMGIEASWRVVWVSAYRAHARTLTDYLAGRVVFAGDAAHQIPIFGVRGLNSGVEDAWNLAWKLARVLKGASPGTLLQSYSSERVAGARENLHLATRTLRFMTPPTRGTRLMRDAVLSLAVRTASVRDLINPRQATLLSLKQSPLSSHVERFDTMASGPVPGLVPGDVLPNLRILRRSGDDWEHASLHEMLGTGFTLLLLDVPAPRESVDDVCVVVVTGTDDTTADVLDRDGVLRRLLCPGSAAVYLVRPDGHIAARWGEFVADDVSDALAVATGRALGATRNESGVVGTNARSDAETVFDELGAALDLVPEGQTTLFLSKLCLLLGLEAGSEAVLRAINEAK
jgi:3-(3-hydroxy-phenyl)propionate hydroxylase